MLWHFTDDFTPRGDIGKYSDDVIARACGWEESPEKLIRSLIDSKWLDANSQHRLLVHDWHEHCVDYTKRRYSGKFWTFPEGSETNRNGPGKQTADQPSLLTSVNANHDDVVLVCSSEVVDNKESGKFQNVLEKSAPRARSAPPRPAPPDTATQSEINTQAVSSDRGFRGESHAKPLNGKTALGDDRFAAFQSLCVECGLPFSEVDLQLTQVIWSKLDFDQQLAATRGLVDRQKAGEFDEESFRPRPDNYLGKRMWQRPVRQRKDTLTERTNTAIDRVLQEEAERRKNAAR